MSINELHYDFKLKQNRIDALTNKDFNAAEIDWLLNEAQLIFIKQRFTTTNKLKKGFETTKKRIEDLSNLVVKYPIQPALVPALVNNTLSIDLDNLVYNHIFIISAYANVIFPTCELVIPMKFIQHDDYLQANRDPFNNSGKEFILFNLGMNSIGNTSMFIYPNNLNIKNINIEYIRYPDRVSLGNYVYIDGVTYPAKTLSVSEQSHSEIVDIAVMLATTASQIPEFLQLNNYKLQNNE